jgi:hypothetical protein
MSELDDTYTGDHYIADRMKVSPQSLLAICHKAINETMASDEAFDLLHDLGLSRPAALSGEFAEATHTTPYEEMEVRQMLVMTAASALTAQAVTGRVSYEDCMRMVDEQFTDDEKTGAYFKTELLNRQALASHAQNQPKLAVKLARQAIKQAYKTEDNFAIFGAKNTEVFVLFHSEQYDQAWHKAKALWKFINDNPDTVHIAENHDFRVSILLMWRSSLTEMKLLSAATEVQDLMFDAGYAVETGEEYRARIIRDFPGFGHLR